MSTHLSYKIMVIKAILELKTRKGSTRFAIKKYILSNYYVNEQYTNSHFCNILSTLVENNII